MAVWDDDEDFNEIDIYDDELVKIQSSGIYKIVFGCSFLPIIDVVQWVATHADFRCLAIVVDIGKVLWFLTPKNFQNIYHLKPTEEKCNKEYLNNLYMANTKDDVLMNPWYQEEEYFKDKVGISKYNTTPFIPPIQYLTVMLSWLHEEADCMFFKLEWIPLAHGVMSTSIVLNWDNILSANILRALEKAIQRPDVKGAPFYLSSFLLDALCASN